MDSKTDYVTLPSKRGAKRGSPIRKVFPYLFLLVVVAAASWWIGHNSGQTNPNEDVKQVSNGSGLTSDSQLVQLSSDDSISPSPSSEGRAGSESSSLDSESRAEPLVAPKVTSPPKVGGLAIMTEPAGARVDVRHQLDASGVTYATPVTLTNLKTGVYRLKVSSDGYRNLEKEIEVTPNKLKETGTIYLERSNGALDIKTTELARYEIFAPKAEGEYELIRSGNTPVSIPNLPAKIYRLALVRDGWPTVTRDVTIADQMTTEISQDFPEGILEITSEPSGAEVWIKGQHQDVQARAGTTPFRAGALPVGAYEVTLKSAEGPDKRLVVQVKSGETANAIASWTKRLVMITSDPPGAQIYHETRRLTGKDNPVTPMEVELLEGSYNLVAVKSGLKDVRLSMQVRTGENVAAHFPFEYGSITLATEPEGAEVFLGNASLGVTPLLLTQIPPGNHQFRIKRERHAIKLLEARVKKGERHDLATKLIYEPTPVFGEDFTNGLGQRMIWINSLNCWVESTETPQRAYQQLTATNPSELVGPDLPVNNVKWSEAKNFCDKLTISDQGQGFVPKGWKYTLPSDEQWSHFAKGTTLAQSVTSQAISREGPERVGSLAPNRFGLYDVRGSMWEWCSDWYTLDVFNREQRENASGKPDRVGTKFRVLRGGSWSRSLESSLDVDYRLLADPNAHHNYESGFRVVLVKDLLSDS